MSSIFDECFIVMSAYGIQRLTKRPGKLARGEVSVKIRLTLPEKVFDEPFFTADVRVVESDIIKPKVDVQVMALPAPSDS